MTTSTTESQATKIYFSDLNDSQKQKLADQLLNVHPMRLQNTIVEYILSKSWEDEEAPFSWDDVTNYEYYGTVEINGCWEDLTEEERDEKLHIYEYLADKAQTIFDDLEDQQQEAENDDQCYLVQDKADRMEKVLNKYTGIKDNLESMDFDEQPEIFQWFSCSDWLIMKLEEHGQCTLDLEFWGRQACGQSVTLDNVIQKIAFEYACDYNKDYLTTEQIEAL